MIELGFCPLVNLSIIFSLLVIICDYQLVNLVILRSIRHRSLSLSILSFCDRFVIDPCPFQSCQFGSISHCSSSIGTYQFDLFVNLGQFVIDFCQSISIIYKHWSFVNQNHDQIDLHQLSFVKT